MLFPSNPALLCSAAALMGFEMQSCTQLREVSPTTMQTQPYYSRPARLPPLVSPSQVPGRTGHASSAKRPHHLGAVASEAEICSTIGGQMLELGGNAADAMVATTFCVGVVGMYHSGIGGGGFMLVRDASGRYEYIDFRETAPAAAHENMYVNRTDDSIYGGLASGVPGDVRGLGYLHAKFGRLPWHVVLQGAIDVARYGFRVSEDLVRYTDYLKDSGRGDFLVEDPVWAVDFAPNGTLLRVGDTMTRKRYANTLETIAKKGPDAFYTGAIAESMIKTLRHANGTMTMGDLANYSVAIREPVAIDYRGYKLTSCSAPASGAVALSIMKIIEGYGSMRAPGWLNLSTHRLDEAMRFGYGQRTALGDPSFVLNATEYEADMLNASTAEAIRGRISDSHTLNVSAYDPEGIEVLDTPGTSHIVTADKDGMAISLTSTINLLFGSQLMDNETGIIMNDEMNDFSIPNTKNAFGLIPSPSNFIRPGKRPLSSITPVIVEHANGSLYFVTGAAGGSRIPTATVQQLWNVLDRDMTAAEALAEPRMHDQLIPNETTFEYSYDNSTVEFMRQRGHNVTFVRPGVSSAQSIRLLGGGVFEAAAEPRQRASGGVAVRAQ